MNMMLPGWGWNDELCDIKMELEIDLIEYVFFYEASVSLSDPKSEHTLHIPLRC